MRRRQYITATAVAATAGLAGCSGVLGGGGGGPAGTAKSWVKAANNGNEDKVEKLTHSDSPMQGSMGFVLTAYEQADVSINSTNVLENEDDVAIVEMEATAKLEGEGEQTSTSEMELRTEDGSWRMWAFRNSGGGTTSA